MLKKEKDFQFYQILVQQQEQQIYVLNINHPEERKSSLRKSYKKRKKNK